MSSWNGGRVHFRERRLPKSVEIPSTNVIIEHKSENNISIFPSKYVNIKHSHSIFSAICAIALNEELYIDEWINYNLLLGFSHIFIYDNSNDNSLKSKASDRVTIIHFPGSVKQLEAYTIFTLQYKSRCKWAAFIDIDEFIVLKKHNNINDLLSEYELCDGVVLNWKMFGTSNETEYKNEPVLKRFKMCSATINAHYKSIVKLNTVVSVSSPHSLVTINGKICDLNMLVINDIFNPAGDGHIACIHHYYTKSEEEFIKKINRGRSDIPEKRSIDELVELHSKNNDVYNSDAWDFYSKYLH
jgi:hypothetical protein